MQPGLLRRQAARCRVAARRCGYAVIIDLLLLCLAHSTTQGRGVLHGAKGAGGLRRASLALVSGSRIILPGLREARGLRRLPGCSIPLFQVISSQVARRAPVALAWRRQAPRFRHAIQAWVIITLVVVLVIGVILVVDIVFLRQDIGLSLVDPGIILAIQRIVRGILLLGHLC